MSIYTKKGDRGETGLPGGRRARKSDEIFHALGTLDKVNALIGLAVSCMEEEKYEQLIDQLQTIQASLLGIGACLASEEPSQALVAKTLPRLTQELEQQIDRWDEILPELNNFIIPGGKEAGAMLHYVRTVVREFERQFHNLDSMYRLEPISQYVNRLSDYFFQAARYYNFTKKEQETIWKQN